MVVAAMVQAVATVVLVWVTIQYVAATKVISTEAVEATKASVRILAESQKSREAAERAERYSRLPIVWCRGGFSRRPWKSNDSGGPVDVEVKRIANVGSGTALNVEIRATTRGGGQTSFRGVWDGPLRPGDEYEASIPLEEFFDANHDYGQFFVLECIYTDVAGECFASETEDLWGRVVVRRVLRVDPEGLVEYGEVMIANREIDVYGGAPWPAIGKSRPDSE